MNTFAFMQKISSLPLIIAVLFLTTLTAFPQQPELILQDAHTTGVLSVALSKDKKLLASAGAANDIRLWDTASGTMLRVLVAPQASNLIFSPHARLLVAEYSPAIGETEITGIWDIRTGKLLVKARHIVSYSFGDDDRSVAICYAPYTGKDGDESKYQTVIKDLAGNGRDRVIPRVETAPDKIVFSKSGKLLSLIFNNGGVRGPGVATYEVSTLLPISLFPAKYLDSFSDELAFVGDPKSSTLALVNLRNGKVIYVTSGQYLVSGKHLVTLRDNMVLISRPETGVFEKSISAEKLGGAKITGAFFSDEGDKLAIKIERQDANGKVIELSRLFDIEHETVSDIAASDALEMSPDKTTFVTTDDVLSGNGRVVVHDAATGGPLKTFENVLFGDADGLRIITGTPYVFSEDSELLVVGKNDGSLELWNARKRETIRTFSSSPVATVSKVEFSSLGTSVAATVKGAAPVDLGTGEIGPMTPQGKPDEYMAVKGANGLELRDTKTGRFLRSLAGFDRFAFSPTQRNYVLEREGRTEVWQTNPNVLRRSFEGTENDPQDKFVGFSPDESVFITAGFITSVWDLRTGNLKWKTLNTLRGNPAYSTDGKLVAITEGGMGIAQPNIYYTATGKPYIPPRRSRLGRGKFDGTILDETQSGGFNLFSDDSRLFASSEGGLISVFDVTTYRLLTTITDEYGVTPMRFTADKKMLVTKNSSGELVFWSLSGKRAARLASAFVFDEKEWLVTTPNGLFDGTPGAWTHLIWRFDNDSFSHAPVEAFFNEFFYPGLLQEIFAGKTPKAPVKDLSKIDIRQPGIEIAAIDGKLAASDAVLMAKQPVKVTVKVTDNYDKGRQAELKTPSGAQDVRLFRNGSLVKVWHGDVLKGLKSVPLEATIPLVAGENRLTAYAFNQDNVKSKDANLTVNGDADSLRRKGKAYILAIGINEYANTGFNLKYAVPDARDFSAELKLQQDKLGTYQPAEITLLPDASATKANILKSLADLAVVMKPEDSLTIYFAGHGKAQQNRFYLIPHDLGYTGSKDLLDAVGMQTIFAHSISDEEIEAAVEGIDAAQMLLVIDACESGQVLKSNEERRGPMNSKGLAQLAYEKGMYILTASQSDQAAKESKLLGHGFLTSALVEDGLRKGLADRDPKDGQILLREWLNYATERVPEMQQEDIVKRQLVRQGAKPGDTPKNINNVQRPRVFYRRETEPLPPIIARP